MLKSKTEKKTKYKANVKIFQRHQKEKSRMKS